jgi:peptidoglycan/LPS O-acetylase OafA/YrhL
VSLTAAVVILVHAATSFGPPFDKVSRLTPQFLALFALGVLAVWLGRHERRETLARPLGILATMAFGTFVVLAATQGAVFMVSHFFWIDLLFGIGVASLLTLMYAGRVSPARRFFGSRGLMFLGLFSYSIYLIHDPIVGMLSTYVFAPMALSPLATFALSLVLGLPLILTFCYGFHLMFEAPFLRQRHLSAIKTMPLVRLWPQWRERRRVRGEAPAEEVPGATLVPAQPAVGEQSAG